MTVEERLKNAEERIIRLIEGQAALESRIVDLETPDADR